MNRWLIAVMGTLLQLCLGTVYAWSYFQGDLMSQYHWTNAQVALTFSLAIGFLGLAAAWGGINLKKYGPRKLAITGGFMFGAGYLLAAFGLQNHSLPLLYLGYGVIGGIGLGLGYVTPVATVAKWFPDRKGMVTGMVIMGFGLGAALMSMVLAPVGLSILNKSYVHLFYVFGAIFLVVTPLVASFLRNPPEGFVPAGYVPSAAKSGGTNDIEHNSVRCVSSARFLLMWLVFFCNIAAGIAVVTFQKQLMIDIFKSVNPNALAVTISLVGTTLIGVSSLFNGIGRFFWGGVSDRIGRTNTFRIMMATQVLAFGALAYTVLPTSILGAAGPWVFAALVCYILLCYGGGFGTMPSFVMEVFGAKKMAVVYGVILTAWSAAAVVGPQIFANIRDSYKTQSWLGSSYSFCIAAGLVGMGLLIALSLLSDKAFRCGKRSLAKGCDANCPQFQNELAAK